MDRVPEPNEISVRVAKILGPEEGDPYPNPDNFRFGLLGNQ